MAKRLLVLALITSGAADRRIEKMLPGVSFSAARSALLGGQLHAANSYGAVKIKKSGAKVFTKEFRHPRGGPTVEHCTVLKDTRSRFELRVDAASPKCPLGDRFNTRVDVALEQKEDGVVLSARSKVRWLSRGRPAGFVSSRVESAAEKGATDAYDTFANTLVDGAAAAGSMPERLVATAAENKGRVFGGVLLGAVVALLQMYGAAAPGPYDDWD